MEVEKIKNYLFYFQTLLYNNRKPYSSFFCKEIQEIGWGGQKTADNDKITLRSSRNKGPLLIVAYLGSENSIYAWLLKIASFDQAYVLYSRSDF